jgi:hypothetical protein
MDDIGYLARIGKIGVAASAALLTVACATVSGPPPTEQLAVANAAAVDAVSAGGPQYATADYTNAQRKLERARAALSVGDNASARDLAEEAELDARLAAMRARSTKANRAAAEVQASIRALRDALERAPQS